MDRGRRARRASDREEKESARGGASRHTDQYGKSCVDVQESRTIEGGGRARRASDGNKKEGAWGGASFHADQYGESSVDILESRMMDGGRRVGRAGDGEEKMVLKEEHLDTLTSMENLVSTFWNQGRWTEAEEMFV
ncbi:uncharacterized protein BDR25DRAFT_378882 [Lindgomyces ingoldianus]|uniref:Uncharacterized protein n=1 Tax=Lindgomyces ingoldianus TaxID=673940 RepID=A0ACB6QFC2_9PLEO|nr:uncharacterized protein BDR25DRAFT_378882 [Lindgomyces ingoldianus]KAF2465663.1 hypothetical protein BDR25DRAFT_378882 [Lindgomyces ingoldianus]